MPRLTAFVDCICWDLLDCRTIRPNDLYFACLLFLRSVAGCRDWYLQASAWSGCNILHILVSFASSTNFPLWFVSVQILMNRVFPHDYLMQVLGFVRPYFYVFKSFDRLLLHTFWTLESLVDVSDLSIPCLKWERNWFFGIWGWIQDDGELRFSLVQHLLILSNIRSGHCDWACFSTKISCHDYASSWLHVCTNFLL